MEGVLSCLNLVQVSSEGLMMESSKKGGSSNNNVEGDGVGASVGGYLQLTVVSAMGRKYLNVDTTTKDGIERANVSIYHTREASLECIHRILMAHFYFLSVHENIRYLL